MKILIYIISLIILKETLNITYSFIIINKIINYFNKYFINFYYIYKVKYKYKKIYINEV
jgi:hypothetical protein